MDAYSLFLYSIAQQLSGITATMLTDKDPFSVVLHKFLEWVSSTTQEVSEQTGKTYHTGSGCGLH